MAQSMQKIPPNNIEAEESLLGAILINQDALLKIADAVRGEDFYKDSHRIIFENIVDLFERHEPIDLLTLGNRLEEKDLLKHIGGRTTLVELTNKVTTAANIVHYAEIIQKKATLRRLLGAATKIAELGYEEAEDIDGLIDDAERTLFNVSSNFIKSSFVPLRSVLSDAFDRIDELHRERGKLRGLPTGFTGVDNLLGGLQKSDLIILAARPSVGKTSFALDIARHVATRAKKPVGLFSLEMSKEQLVDRMICAEANVDLWKLRTGRLSDKEEDFPRIGQAIATLSEAPVFIDDSASANIMTIRTKARRLMAEHGLSMIVIDYLQLMEGRNSKPDNRTQEVAEISRGLKQIGRELQIPVLALAQLSRAVEMSKPAIPKLSHLRESGSIEQDADVVMFLYRKAADRNFLPEELTPDDQNSAEVHIAKHRNGPTGMVKIFWDKKRASFRNLEMQHTTPTPPPAQQGGPGNIGLPPGVAPKWFNQNGLPVDQG
ncbi:MAG: replicative DNA helicase [Patescibacteria group bacterium]